MGFELPRVCAYSALRMDLVRVDMDTLPSCILLQVRAVRVMGHCGGSRASELGSEASVCAQECSRGETKHTVLARKLKVIKETLKDLSRVTNCIHERVPKKSHLPWCRQLGARKLTVHVRDNSIGGPFSRLYPTRTERAGRKWRLPTNPQRKR